MHEMSIAIQLVETIRTVATDNGLRQVDEVALEVGPMTLIVPEALREAFALAAEGSPAAGAALEIKEVPLLARCRGCGRHWEPRVDDFRCPACRRADVDILAGGDIILRSVVGRGDDDQGAPDG